MLRSIASTLLASALALAGCRGPPCRNQVDCPFGTYCFLENSSGGDLSKRAKRWAAISKLVPRARNQAKPSLAAVATELKRWSFDDVFEFGLRAFVAEWERQPLLEPTRHVSAEARTAQHDQRLANSATGLANSLRGMGAGQQTSLWSKLAAFSKPSLLIVGELDGRYRQVGERMHSLLPDSELEIVGQAGHTVHLDQPDRFVEIVRRRLYFENSFSPRNVPSGFEMPPAPTARIQS